MRTVLVRTGVGIAAFALWLGLIVTTILASFHGTAGGIVASALTIITMAYVVLISFAVAVMSDHEDSDPRVGKVLAASVICAVIVAFLGLVSTIGFDAWYLNHYGVDTTARVAQEHCDGPASTNQACEQRLRVVAASTNQDLGWVGCNGTGYWRVGDAIRVRNDPRGMVPPSVDNCPPERFLDTVIPLTLILAVVTVITAAAAPALHRRPLPQDTPGWRPNADD